MSGDIPYNIINILYCYVYVWRYYNTSINDVPLQAIEVMIIAKLIIIIIFFRH